MKALVLTASSFRSVPRNGFLRLGQAVQQELGREEEDETDGNNQKTEA